MPVLFYFWRCCVISNREHQINEEIRDKELRVIDVDGNQLGILSADEALKIAFEKDLDLVDRSSGNSACMPYHGLWQVLF